MGLTVRSRQSAAVSSMWRLSLTITLYLIEQRRVRRTVAAGVWMRCSSWVARRSAGAGQPSDAGSAGIADLWPRRSGARSQRIELVAAAGWPIWHEPAAVVDQRRTCCDNMSGC